MFYRGYDVAGDHMWPDMTQPATVSTFRLDQYEVTVGRFRTFVMAGQGTQQDPPTTGVGEHPNVSNNSGWDASWNASLVVDSTEIDTRLQCDATSGTWTDQPGANENRPIVCITWYEAFAFCAWDGGFLPTEAEWHYAASGGAEQRAYPWSTPPGDLTLDCAHANNGGPNPPTTACVPRGTDDVGATSPVGDGKWGQADLAGNAWEYVLDWYAPYPSPCNDCANLVPAPNRAIRGGSFEDGANGQRASTRYDNPPPLRVPNVGVRCARSVP